MKSLSIKLGNQKSSVIFSSKDSIIQTILKRNEYLGCSSYLIVCDENVAPLFKHDSHNTFVLPSGESSKNYSSIMAILSYALQKGLTRNSLFIGVGGGVICDMCAFAASIYKRGVKLALVPTTLLSMVDASIGGKTGIDFEGYKNQVGTFYPAQVIAVCSDFLDTLCYEQYRSGLGEVIKSALLRDKKLLYILFKMSDKIKAKDKALLEEIIFRTIFVKAYYVTKDFTEQNIRAHLNLGHSFAHSLEAYYECGSANTVVSHGDAVAWGLLQANRLAQFYYAHEPKTVNRLKSNYKELLSLLKEYGFPLDFSTVDRDALIFAMKKDKKNIDTKIRFVIQKEFHKSLLIDLDQNQLKEFDFTLPLN